MVPCPNSVLIARRERFVYHRTMPVDEPDGAVSSIAAAIGEPARARMLYCLLDGRARTATELAAVADVAPSTTSAHLRRLEKQRLVKLAAQGKHRYFSLDGVHVAAALEALSVLAGGSGPVFVPNTPGRLRAARTCYDHIAGTLGVLLHDRLRDLRWLCAAGERAYDLTPLGVAGLENSASTSTRPARSAAASRLPVSTGASGVIILLARLALPCSARC